MTGKFITFEGVDGGGKSTQAAELAEHLRRTRGADVVETREPGGTAFGEMLREMLLRGEQKDAITETLLMFAARRQHIAEKIRPALDGGAWVVCDRFADSSVAYQGGGRGVEMEFINFLIASVCAETMPDLTFYIQSPAALRGGGATLLPPDVFEKEAAAFFEKVQGAYEQLAKTKERIVVVRAMAGADGGARRGRDEVAAEIAAAVDKMFPPAD